MAKKTRKGSGIDFTALIGFIVISQLAGVIGSVFTFESVSTWYSGLDKPFFNPPSWVFGPVWTTLYLLMGVAAYLVWEKRAETPAVRSALAWFGTQLALNTAWSIAFFGLRSPWAGVAVIALLWIAIIATIRAFWGVRRPSAYLMVPYILWVSFAAVLNLSLALMNP
jgi:tryptophan-rich sensory protein